MKRKQHEMVEEQIASRGVGDPLVLEAMRRVPRDLFVPEAERDSAYGDHPLSIGYGQTISQPYIVAFMTESVSMRPGERVLEIGTGSGYAAAVLAEVGASVISLETIEPLAEKAKENLVRAGYPQIKVFHADGALGWPEEAPYDAILVTAAASEVPERLLEQLAVGGRLVMPVGDFFLQELVRIVRVDEGKMTRESLLSVRFVPLT